MPIEFACPACKKSYRVKDELAGKTAKCSGCQGKIQIPQAATKAASQPAVARAAAAPTAAVKKSPATKSDDMSSWMDAELSGEVAGSAKRNPTAMAAVASSAAPPSAAKTSAGACPSCKKPLVAGSVLCVSCGYDTRKGKKLTTKVETGEESEGPSKLATSASFLRGAIFSMIGAAIGAGIWAAVAIYADIQIGWIAWGLGGLAGLGMSLGHDDKDGTLAGITAAGIAILGIVAAKFILWSYVRDKVAEIALALNAAGKVPDDAVPFSTLFSPIDGLFVLLAVGTAYKIGSGKVTD